MAAFSLLLLLVHCTFVYALEYGTCDEPFIIFKHTVATSDSARECANYYHIFPDIHDEGASKFNDGECAHQCKLELPYTCFKIHAPQTQFEQGLLNIDTFERKLSEKWKYALDSHKYDTFFDNNNIAFWVESLDDYILHWQSNNAKLEYFGIEWNLYDIAIEDSRFENHKFYSILIHSPQSPRQFEFMSYIKPRLYDSIPHWLNDDIPRCTFQLQSSPFPWERSDKARIVPVRISQSTTNIDKMYDFYVNILEGQLIYYANGVQRSDQTIFMSLTNTHIELQFVQRSLTSDSDSFTLEKYENLLMETHKSVITSPFCGQDRWMDNHYAFETYVIPGLLDKIYYNLNKNGIKYTVHKNTAQHVSTYIKHQLELIHYSGQYTFGLWIIEPSGFSIKMGGVISDPNVAIYANTNDPQWCPKECNWGLQQGTVDPSHMFMDDMYGGFMLSKIIRIRSRSSYKIYAIILFILLVFLFLIYHYLCYYVYVDKKAKPNCIFSSTSSSDHDYVPI